MRSPLYPVQQLRRRVFAWAVKLRVKSMSSLMLGMPAMEAMPPAARQNEKPAEPSEKAEKTEKKPNPLDLLKGILGR